MTLIAIQPFLPLVFSISIGILGYLFGVRTRKIDRFFSQVQENLDQVSSPLFHDVRAIERQVRSYDRDRLLEILFYKYGGAEHPIYKIGNRYIWECYYQLEDKYYAFSKNRTQENWSNFWVYFDQFSSKVKSEYKLNSLVMSRQYEWMRFISGKGFLTKLYHETCRILYETLTSLVIASMFLIFFIFWDVLSGSHLMSEKIISLSFSGISIISVFWGLSMLSAGKYISLTSLTLEKSVVRLLVERKFPKTYQSWDKKFGGQPERFINKVKIPEM